MPRKRKNSTHFCIQMTTFCFIIFFSWMNKYISSARAYDQFGYGDTIDDDSSIYNNNNKNNYGGLCRSDSECDENQFLLCIKGMCLCYNEDNSVLINGQCTVKAEQNCEGNPICIKDAYCNSNKICECDFITGFEPYKGNCYLGHKAQCDSAVYCMPDTLLECSKLTGKCECPSRPYRNYRWSKSQRKCVLKPDYIPSLSIFTTYSNYSTSTINPSAPLETSASNSSTTTTAPNKKKNKKKRKPLLQQSPGDDNNEYDENENEDKNHQKEEINHFYTLHIVKNNNNSVLLVKKSVYISTYTIIFIVYTLINRLLMTVNLNHTLLIN